MTDETSAQTPETQALTKAYDALNRNDLAGFLDIFASDLVRIEPPGFPGVGTFHGLEAFKSHVAVQRAKWADGSCAPQRFFVSGDRVVVFVHVHVMLKGETEWREGDIADGFAFRDGRVIHFQTFVDRNEALAWATGT